MILHYIESVYRWPQVRDSCYKSNGLEVMVYFHPHHSPTLMLLCQYLLTFTELVILVMCL